MIGALAALLLHLAVLVALGGGSSILRADAGAGLMETVLGHLSGPGDGRVAPAAPEAAEPPPGRRPA